VFKGRKLFAAISLENRLVRAVGTAAIVGISSLALWQAGVLFRSPNEDVALTDDAGQTVVLEIRAADASIQTPDAVGLAVGVGEGKLAPDFEVSTLTGERVRLSDFRGRAVFLNFWASWCGPCRVEMPDIQALLDDHAADGLVVLALNNGEPFKPANQFVDDLGLRFTAIGLDPSRQVIDRYRVRAMPTSIFIDPDGVITKIHAGLATAGQMDEFVRQALGLSLASQ